MTHWPLVPVALAVLSAVASAQSIPGERIMTRLETTASGTGMLRTTNQRMVGSWTTMTETARGRTRIEVAEGVQPGAKPGVYILADSLGVMTVDPETKTFTILGTGGGPVTPTPPLGVTVSTRLENVEVSVDSVAMTDSVSGTPAMRYVIRAGAKRVATIARTGAAATENQTTTASTYEYWYASGPAGAAAPLMPPRPPAFGATMDELATKMHDAFARLPRRRIIRSAVTTHNLVPAGSSETRSTSHIVKSEGVTIDATRLMLPAGYTERPMSGATPVDPAWLARWNAPPLAR